MPNCSGAACPPPTASRKAERLTGNHPIGRKIIVDVELALELAGRKQRTKLTGGMAMDYIKETKDISAEEAIILWQASRLSLSKSYEKAPEILKVHGSVIGTLGNFSASIGKTKSKKTFNVSAIVAAALEHGTVSPVCGGTRWKISGKCFMLSARTKPLPLPGSHDTHFADGLRLAR